jgi:outer membrane translocation and assembly module TamA
MRGRLRRTRASCYTRTVAALRPRRRPPTPAALLSLALAASACGGPETRRIAPTVLIDEIELVGVHHFSHDALLGHLHLGEDSWVPFSPEFPFDEAWLPMNMRRIEALYRSAGFPEARVLGIDVHPDGDDEVDLTIRVEEGERVRVSALTFDWQDAAEVSPEERKAVEGAAALKPEGGFDVAGLNDSVGSLRQALRGLGHPLARVTTEAEVYEDAHRAEVRLRVTAGPRAVVGAIRFEGLVDVPQERVYRETDFALGLLDTPGLEDRVERAVSGMDVFRWVTVKPADRVENGKVDLIVQMAEAHPQTLRIGAGFTFEANRWEERAAIDYTHTNLFGDLTRLDLKVHGGWAELPDPFDPNAHGPMLEIAPAFSRKGLLEPYLTWSLTPAFEVNIEEGYQYWSPTGRLGVSRWFAGQYKLALSQNVRYVEFFDVDPTLNAEDSLLGRDFRDPYFLSYLEFQADAFFTDNLLAPENGVSFGLTWDIAGGVLQGDFDHHKVVAGSRAWWRPFERLKFAAKAETGMIFLYGDEPAVPFDRKLYLGGADMARGWGQRRLSPKLEDIPIGGLTSVLGMLQAMARVAGPVWLVAFADLGDVQSGEAQYVFGDWNYSAGPGLRVDTPLGLVRLDVGFRLNAPGKYPDEPAWAAHFGLGEAF